MGQKNGVKAARARTVPVSLASEIAFARSMTRDPSLDAEGHEGTGGRTGWHRAGRA